MKTIGFSMVLVALGLGSAAQGCAKAADTGGSSDGVGGFEGSGGSVAEGAGPSTSSAGGSSSTTGSTTATMTSSSASSSASAGAGMGCPADQHQCGGVCTGNTPQTGCFGSSDCLACPPAPVNGTASCAADGTCDFTCGASYTKQGNSCVCSLACCTNAECDAGSTCMGGSCSIPPPTCNGAACTAGCLLSCGSQEKFGVGTCINNACVCACL